MMPEPPVASGRLSSIESDPGVLLEAEGVGGKGNGQWWLQHGLVKRYTIYLQNYFFFK